MKKLLVLGGNSDIAKVAVERLKGDFEVISLDRSNCDLNAENATDMIALRGTTVEVAIAGSQALSGGRIVFSDGKSVPLTVTGEKAVAGKVVIDRNVTFRIELTNTNRQSYLGLEEYSMEALDDQNPILE